MEDGLTVLELWLMVNISFHLGVWHFGMAFGVPPNLACQEAPGSYLIQYFDVFRQLLNLLFYE